MSNRYKGGIISATPPTTSTSSASGAWTLEQQMQAQAAGTWPSPPIFIEDLFSTYLVTGDGSAPAVNNGIDVSGQGGLVWIKKRSEAGSNSLFDTARGANLRLISNDTAAQDSVNLSFTSTGFSNYTFDSAVNYVSWTFREQPKFFDVVTYTGNGSAGGQTINHNLGSTPGCIIVKQTNVAVDWRVYHQTQGISKYASLNTTAAFATDANNPWKTPTSTTFGVGDGTYWTSLNESGGTYVAYLFAHDAGGFPVSGSGSTNGISCGSFTTDGSGNINSGSGVSLGYEPQFIIAKRTDSSTAGSWNMVDNMRGWVATPATTSKYLFANSSGAEGNFGSVFQPTATGFSGVMGGTSATYIYIAIRRGPMKTPTTGTQVFSPEVQTPTAGANNNMAANSGFPIDWLPTKQTGNVNDWYATTRITNNYLSTNSTAAEGAYTYGFDRMAGVGGGSSGWEAQATVSYAFKRAPGFFDVVCYTGNGTAGQTFSHNLTVLPELIIIKRRDAGASWIVGQSKVSAWLTYLYLNATNSIATASTVWNDTAPTSSVFTVGDATLVNDIAATYVAYLFATCAGVSKVGSYTGNGATQTINCGFTSGARFVIIKQTDAAGSWFTYDTARGMTVSTNPYLRINNTAAEIATLGSVTTVSTGFALDSNILPDINFNAGTYIFLAIA